MGGADCFGHCWGCSWHFSPNFFAKCLISICSLARENALVWKVFHPPEIGRNLWGGYPLCWDWGAHAKMAVLMPKLRCSCWDWGAHAEIAVLMPRLSTLILAWAPHSRHEHLNTRTATTTPKVTAYFRGMKWNFELFLQLGDVYKIYILEKKLGENI